MPLILDESILDLNAFGLVTLTQGASHALPLPGHKFGYATYHSPDGAMQDRLYLFSRALSASELTEAVNLEHAHLSGAVASVRGYIDYVRDEVCEEYLEMPSHAFPLLNGRVLLFFAAQVRPYLMRIVDVVHNKVVSEETIPDLRKRLGVSAGLLARFGNDAPVVYSHSENHFVIYLGTEPLVLRVANEQLQRVIFPWVNSAFNLQFTRSLLVEQNNERNKIRVGALNGPTEAREYTSSLTKKAGFMVSTASQSDRVALAHPNGIIEIVEGGQTCTHILRPLPRANGKEGSFVTLSPNGAYALIVDDAGTVVIDIDGMRIADVFIPNTDLHYDPAQFDPNMQYRGTHAINNQGGYVLHKQELLHTPHNSLEWRSLAMHDPRARKPKTSTALNKMLATIHRPALAMKISRKPTNSKFYGAPRIAQIADWPMHDGERMLPLCELNLHEVATSLPASGLPMTGGLSVFVAVDDDGVPLVDDMFDPVAAHVRFTPSFTEHTMEFDNMPVFEAQMIAYKLDESVYPQLDSIAIEVAQLSDDGTDEYRIFLDEKLPDGATSGHRLGGYPHIMQNNDLEARAFEKKHGHFPQNANDQREAARWHLLMQIDSDENIMWGTDSGMLYLMIHEGDLQCQDYSNVIALTDGC
jgi:uncharacterized protein YwqG